MQTKVQLKLLKSTMSMRFALKSLTLIDAAPWLNPTLSPRWYLAVTHLEIRPIYRLIPFRCFKCAAGIFSQNLCTCPWNSFGAQWTSS